MGGATLITPTLHVEVQLAKSVAGDVEVHAAVRKAVAEWLQCNYVTVNVGKLDKFHEIECSAMIRAIHVADYTGPHEVTGYYSLPETKLDVQAYVLRSEHDTGQCRIIRREGDSDGAQARIVALPNEAFNEEWDSLVFDDGLPSRLLRYLVRMVAMMGKPGLSLATFNWNKICLLHGPPGSGKSTLCRAIAQKLSIRLGDLFPNATLIEINANSMLSKYFGESGKLIGSTFDQVVDIAKDSFKLVVVVIDEVETIASCRQRASNSGECNDGLRATNQLLTALDRCRGLPNILICCTSNLIEAIDPAFLDRVDIKQYVPPPSSAAVYNIFRSCLNELLRTNLVAAKPGSEAADENVLTDPSSLSSTKQTAPASCSPRKRRRVTDKQSPPPIGEDERCVLVPVSSSSTTKTNNDELFTVPTLPTTLMSQCQDAPSIGQRIWQLAQKCQGLCLSGRTLRRLPVLGLAMYTWGGEIGMQEAVGALEKAVEEEEVAAMKTES